MFCFLVIILLLGFSYKSLEDNKYFRAASGQMSGYCSKVATRLSLDLWSSYFVN